MKEFNEMLFGILKRGNERLNIVPSPEARLKVLEDIRNELAKMREIYDILNGQVKPSGLPFEEHVNQIK